jgi:hypothetical protein
VREQTERLMNIVIGQGFPSGRTVAGLPERGLKCLTVDVTVFEFVQPL